MCGEEKLRRAERRKCERGSNSGETFIDENGRGVEGRSVEGRDDKIGSKRIV